jgi:ABC-type transport system involved in multi-copper enzyme maturation permease subunit
MMLKSARELLPVTVLLGMLLLVIEAVLAYVLPTFAQQFSAQFVRIQFFQSIIKAMLGTDLAEGIGPEMFSAIPWVHPVVLAILWAHAIICCTRVPAGEVDRGTIDVLLALPVSRWSVYVSDSFVWIVSAIALLGFAVAGNALGTRQMHDTFHAAPVRVTIVVLNLFCLYLSVGAAAWFISALSDRRGRAIGVVFVLVVASFLLNYLAQFWQPAKHLAPLGVLRYYRPLFILRDGTWPLWDTSVLLAAGATLWMAGGLLFARRDLSAL